jgi:hypothetical protein
MRIGGRTLAGSGREHFALIVGAATSAARLPILDRWMLRDRTVSARRDDTGVITARVDKETSALLRALNDQRNHVLGILGLPDLDGDVHMAALADDVLRRPVLPSGWSCLGLVKHLTVSDERLWFRGIIGGDSSLVSAFDDAWLVAGDTPADDVFKAYRHEIELADTVIAGASLDAPPAMWPVEMWPTWRLPDFRAVMLHMITETACHAGHLDAARELIDGEQWLG